MTVEFFEIKDKKSQPGHGFASVRLAKEHWCAEVEAGRAIAHSPNKIFDGAGNIVGWDGDGYGIRTLPGHVEPGNQLAHVKRVGTLKDFYEAKASVKASYDERKRCLELAGLRLSKLQGVKGLDAKIAELEIT